MLSTAIAGMHFQPSAVASAEAASRLMQKESFDILLLDLNLPGINGMEFLETLAQSKPRPQVIIHTGFGRLEDAKRALRLDVVDFLTKPCTLAELEQALDRARHRQLETLVPQSSIDIDDTVEEPQQPSAVRTNTTPDASVNTMTLDDVERNHILSVLERNNGNRSLTAEQLGISIRTLYYRLEQYQKSGHIR
jgi:DNA-binding NtrC family response regulator